MRIGLIAEDFPPQIGGMAQHARDVAEALSATDHIIVYTRPDCGIDNAPFEQKKVISGDLSDDLTKLSGATVDVWLTLNAGYVALSPVMRAPMFAYFHGNDFLNPWIANKNSLVRNLHRVPYFWRFANPTDLFFRKKKIKNGIRSVHHIFTNSNFTKGLIQSIFSVQDDKISVVHPTVQDQFFQDYRKSPSDILRILTIARLSREAAKKNVESCLRAVARLRDRLSFRYTIVGDGDDRPRLEMMSRELGLDEQVKFVGSVDDAEIPAFYRSADIFLLASKRSKRDVEGFGIVYIEAAASGVPSICSAEGGATDAVEDGVSGIVIPTSSPEEIALGVLRLAQARSKYPPNQVRTFAERFRQSEAGRKIRNRIILELK